MLGVTLTCALFVSAHEPWALEWGEDARCRDEDAARARIDDVAQRGDLRGVRMDTHRADDGLAVNLLIETSTGAVERSFRAGSCDQILEVAALLTAFHLAEEADQRAAMAPTPSPAPVPPPSARKVTLTPPPAPTRAPERSPGQSLAREATPPPKPLPKPTFDLRAGATGGYGRRPIYDLGVAGELGLGGPRWRVALGGAWRPGLEIQAGDLGGRFSHWAIHLGVGPRKSWRRVALGGLLGLEAGQLRGVGQGGAENRRANLPWVAVFAGPDLTVDLVGPLALWMDAALTVNLRRQTFAFDDVADPLYRAPAVGVSAQLGLAIEFGDGSRSPTGRGSG